MRTIYQAVTAQPYMPAFISRGAVLFEEFLASERSVGKSWCWSLVGSGSPTLTQNYLRHTRFAYRMARMPPIMDWDEYVSVAHDCGIAPDQVMTVTKHFHRIGTQPNRLSQYSASYILLLSFAHFTVQA